MGWSPSTASSSTRSDYQKRLFHILINFYFLEQIMIETWKKCGHDITTGEPNWQADMLKRPGKYLPSFKYFLKSLSIFMLGRKFSKLELILKKPSPAGKFEHPSSAIQKQSVRGSLAEWLKTSDGGTNLKFTNCKFTVSVFVCLGKMIFQILSDYFVHWNKKQKTILQTCILAIRDLTLLGQIPKAMTDTNPLQTHIKFHWGEYLDGK